MKKLKQLSTIFAGFVFAALSCLAVTDGGAFAGAFSVSPTNEKIALTPGSTYYGSFMVANPGTSDSDFSFSATVDPFSADGDGNSVKLESSGEYNQITNWITVLDGFGTISPNQNQIVHYIIDVPDNAPAGGQYAAISVKSTTSEPVEGALNIQQQVSIAYLIYAEVAGDTIHSGTIESVDVTSFLFSGNVAGSSTIKNNGNTHATATYTLQVYPLFSSEEVYTNEENPATALIMPGATRYNSTEWENTPGMGMYRVVYTVDFEGEQTVVEKMVIVCPIWLLIVILAFIFMVIFWLVSRSKERKKK